MSLRTKQIIIAALAFLFLTSLVFVQWLEVARRKQEAGLVAHAISLPAKSRACIECHEKASPGVVDHWEGSTHAVKGVGCLECHAAQSHDVDAFDHYGQKIATIVTPRDCGRCHQVEYNEFEHSHHAKGGNILASLDNLLAETIEGSRAPFNPHSPTPGMAVQTVNGMASVNSGCKQCHGSKITLEGTDGSLLTVDDLKPDADGKATNLDAVGKIKRDAQGRPMLHASSWPNTGIGRINLDGSLGSCSACHSRHDFSPRRARQPENCGKCHLGPDHPQAEIFEESKHGVAFRDLKDHMNLNSHKWILGQDYTQAPTCATCHMSGNSRNGGKITHDPGQRISWTNRPPVSLVMDTDANGQVIKSTDPAERKELTKTSWQDRRTAMKQVCTHCHTENYVSAFYTQYDEFVVNYNEKFAKPGQKLIAVLREQKLLTPSEFDEEVEWTWYLLWHHEGRRARHGASMMAPDYAHWHGMFEVAERFYMELIPQVREVADHAEAHGKKAEAEAVRKVVDELLARPEHQWFEKEKVRLASSSVGEAGENKPAGDQPPSAPASSNQAAKPDEKPDSPAAAEDNAKPKDEPKNESPKDGTKPDEKKS